MAVEVALVVGMLAHHIPARAPIRPQVAVVKMNQAKGEGEGEGEGVIREEHLGALTTKLHLKSRNMKEEDIAGQMEATRNLRNHKIPTLRRVKTLKRRTH